MMCGRFHLIADGEQIAAAFELDGAPFVAPRYNIAPTQPVAAVRLDARGRREWTHFVWGLIPSWSQDPRIGARLINARAETAVEKPSFRAAFRRRRCLIPATGFYEWRQVDGRKQALQIGGAHGQLLALAGLWEHWTGPDGSELQSCAILTGEPNELVRPIHDRMPVIVAPADYALWLDPQAPLPAVQAVARTVASAAELRAWPVGPAVNSPRYDGPDCLTPVAAA